MPNMVMSRGERHGVGGGLRSLTALLVTLGRSLIDAAQAFSTFDRVATKKQ